MTAIRTPNATDQMMSRVNDCVTILVLPKPIEKKIK
jgi:hypothetical protein